MHPARHTILTLLICAAAGLWATGCSSDHGDGGGVKGAGKVPTVTELTGRWVNVDHELHTRVVLFEKTDTQGVAQLAGESDVYHVWS